MMDRRDFLRLAAAAGLLGPAGFSCQGVSPAAAPSTPLGTRYLERGLVALSDAHHRGWLRGHYGAAVLSSYYFARENGLDERTARALESNIEAFIERSPGEFPAPDPGRGTADAARIVERLDGQIADLRVGGHDVIFAALALRALRDLPAFATPSVVDGICRLLELVVSRNAPVQETPYNRAHPLPEFAGSKDIATITLRETLRPWGDVMSVGASGVVHWITHADSLVTLDELGYAGTARRGHAALRLHVNRQGGADPRNEPDRAPVDWLGPAYWESDTPRRLFGGSWLAGHAFKLPYSLFRLLRREDNPQVRIAVLVRASHLQVPFE